MSLEIIKNGEKPLKSDIQKRATFINEIANALETISEITEFDFTKTVNAILLAGFESGNKIVFNTPSGNQINFKCDSGDGKTNLLKLAKELKANSSHFIEEEVKAPKFKPGQKEVQVDAFEDAEAVKKAELLNKVKSLGTKQSDENPLGDL